MKKKRFIFLIILSIITAQVLLITFMALVSPYPVSNLLKYAFTLNPYEVEVANLNVTTETYQYDDNNELDIIYSPDNENNNNPTIIWIHGGGFVGGDKEDVNPYLSNLANEGYTVVSINYSLAPKVNFPNQLFEIGNVFKYLETNAFDNVNLNKLLIGGDSAGAHIALNFITHEFNSEYRNLTNTEQMIDISNIKGVILYCGPYDFINLSKKDSLFASFFYHKMGWAYTGNYHWKDHAELLYMATINYHVSKNFPPVFITDANNEGMFDFENDAFKLVTSLEANDIKVSGVLDYKDSDYKFKNVKTYEDAFGYSNDQKLIVNHNYQFRLEQYYDNDTLKNVNDNNNSFSPGHIILDELLNFLKVI